MTQGKIIMLREVINCFENLTESKHLQTEAKNQNQSHEDMNRS
jgi:hypothetical protein